MIGARPSDPDRLARDVARCFASATGLRVLDHLRQITFERRLAPDCGEAELRHLEGQRFLLAHLLALQARGAAGPPDLVDPASMSPAGRIEDSG